MRHHAALLALATLVVSCGGSSSTGTSNNNPPVIPSSPGTPVVTTSVAMQSSAFSPANIQVAKGAIVTFTNNDSFNHNVTFTDAAVGSTGNFSSGAKTLTMPSVVGDYPYRCTIHGGMSGTVSVK